MSYYYINEKGHVLTTSTKLSNKKEATEAQAKAALAKQEANAEKLGKEMRAAADKEFRALAAKRNVALEKYPELLGLI